MSALFNTMLFIIVASLLMPVHLAIDASSEKRYLVDTGQCKIPNYEAFNEETLRIWAPQQQIECSKKPLLTYVEKFNGTAKLKIKEHLLPLYGRNISCCMSDVIREKLGKYPDDSIRFSPCKTFKGHIELNNEAVEVICTDARGLKVYKNTHYAVLRRDSELERPENSTHSKPISVLFVVIDSVSRLNLIRTMPKTYDYLIKNGFIEMKGYNKIDDNTFPNVMALLSGLNRSQTKEGESCNGKTYLDNCPLIWNSFRNLGYATAYGEDWGELGTFNYWRKGFLHPPTTHYLRPYVLASEMNGMLELYRAPYCAGAETSGERQLNVAFDFVKTYKNEPYFGIFWMNTYSHQNINTPLMFDNKLRAFFGDLNAERILDDSIVILLADHGMRVDPAIRNTFPGWFEERLPMNLISVPRWFRYKYPTEYSNLKDNSDKLTSTYDFHMTLQHILKLSHPEYKITPSNACSTCLSFFEKIPQRSCRAAGIPIEWCTCLGYLQPLDKSTDLVKDGVRFAIEHMNADLKSHSLENICSELEIDSIETAGLSEISDGSKKILFLNFITRPFGDFIVSLKYDSNQITKFRFKILFRIILLRYNRYKCRAIDRPIPSQYCICKPENSTVRTNP